jgi:hypothetical protein
VLPRVNRLICFIIFSFLLLDSWAPFFLRRGHEFGERREQKKKEGASGVFFVWFLLSDINDFDLIIINFLCIKIYL